MMTIAELVEAIEQITEAKVTQVAEVGEMLTFKVEWPQPAWRYEEPECKMCGKDVSLNDEGYCSSCWMIWNS